MRAEGESPVQLGRHMAVAVLTPLILLLVMGIMLAWQVARLGESARHVRESNEIIATFFLLRSRLAEQETSLRGWLLSGNPARLQEFHTIDTRAPLEAVAGMTSTDAEQSKRITDVRRHYETWRAAAQASTQQDWKVGRDDRASLAVRVESSARVRALLKEGVQRAQGVLAEREQKNEQTERGAQLAFFGLLAATALAIGVVSRRQLATVSQAFERVVEGERAARKLSARQAWVRRGEADLGAAVIGDKSLEEVGDAALGVLCAHTGAIVGALYVARPDELLRIAGHAVAATTPERLPLKSGLLGQVAIDGKPRRLAEAEAQVELAGGVAESRTVELCVAPAKLGAQSIAVLELGFERAADERLDELLAAVGATIAVAVRGAEQRARLNELLTRTQLQGEELQTQHEELRVTNEELEQQGEALRGAQARQAQIQHQLEATNADLEEQTATLEQQREELLGAQRELERRARELQLASQYKSDFLARMSHELRTPLNSSLILARLLGDNPDGNLTDEQVQFANTIYAAGNDLLLVINDILDLAKIEAGRMELRLAHISLPRLRDSLLRELGPMAKARGLRFHVELTPDVPTTWVSDEQRVVQVLRNLISNAFKFTERGEVVVTVRRADATLQLAVRDTGVGIALEHHDTVFDAFHQVDGSVSRKHGGTGLGLAISRDLSKLLGGELTVESAPGEGSVFTLVLPLEPPTGRVSSSAVRSERQPAVELASPAAAEPATPAAPDAPAAAAASTPTPLDPSRRTLLVIEDDLTFAHLVMDLAGELGFQVIHAATADQGVALALRHQPDGILLDVNLPDHSGLSVLERLKRQPQIRHVPVHMLSVDDHAQRSLELGAIGYLLKPASRAELTAAIHRIEDRTAQRVRRLLIVEDDAVQVEALEKLLESDGVKIDSTGSVSEAVRLLSTTTFDCIVMDLWLSDGTGFELLERMTADERMTFPPVIVHTGKDLTADEENQLRQCSSSIILKGARSPERLLDEVTLFLHQVEADLPPDRQRLLREIRDREAIFEGRTVLVVEDDVRNVFALSSILEPRGLTVRIARNGREACEQVAGGKIDLVLMDIMMPEMDGLEATRRIRAAGSKVPIVALTAKAMADDRQACLEAGANDYLAKPIHVDMLLSLLRVWMPR